MGSPAVTDAVILSVGQSWARAWALKRISDRSGNAIVFTYEQDTVNGAYRVEAVDYTSSANPSATVPAPYQIDFAWEAVPVAEIDSSYMAGSRIKRVKRLDRIDVLHGTDIVRRYELADPRSCALVDVPESTGFGDRMRGDYRCPIRAATTCTYQNGTGGTANGHEP